MNRYDIALKKPIPIFPVERRDKRSVNRRKKDVINKIVDQAFFESCFTAYPTRDKIRNALTEGRRIPPEARPGYVINQLPEEERELIRNMTEKDFNHRLFE